MSYNRKDHFFRKAKKENYAARSIYKLDEIDQRFRLIHPGDQVLDLGAAPGSWSQYVSGKIGPKGKLLSIDLQPIRLTLPNTVFLEADLRDLELGAKMAELGFTPPFQAVISDMAPKTTGIKITDQARSLELCEIALDCANRFLAKGGNFVCKFFHSSEFEAFRAKLRATFEKVEVLRPESTRKESKEIFYIGLRKKAGPE